MRTQPDYPKPPGKNTAALIWTLAFSIVLLLAIMTLTGCACRIECAPDISAAARVLRIIPEK